MTGKPDSGANSSNSGTSDKSSVTGIAQRLAQSRPASVPSSGAPVPKKKKPTPKQATKKKASSGNKKNTKKMKKDQSEEKSEQPPSTEQTNNQNHPPGKKKYDGETSWIQTSDENDHMVFEAFKNLFPHHGCFKK